MFDVFHGFVAAAENKILLELVEHEMNKRSTSPRAEFCLGFFFPPVGAIIKTAHPLSSLLPDDRKERNKNKTQNQSAFIKKQFITDCRPFWRSLAAIDCSAATRPPGAAVD